MGPVHPDEVGEGTLAPPPSPMHFSVAPPTSGVFRQSLASWQEVDKGYSAPDPFPGLAWAKCPPPFKKRGDSEAKNWGGVAEVKVEYPQGSFGSRCQEFF